MVERQNIGRTGTQEIMLGGGRSLVWGTGKGVLTIRAKRLRLRPQALALALTLITQVQWCFAQEKVRYALEGQ